MRRLSLAGILVAVLAVSACATTAFKSTWKAPDAQPVSLAGQKVLALVMSKSEAGRRAAELSLARELNARGAAGVPAHTIDGLDPKNEEASKARLAKDGFEGVVVMRAVGTSQQTSYSPATVYTSPYYGHFWGGYYGYGWGSVYDPGYLRTDTIVSVETLVYSLKQDKLIWAGTSATTNPSNVDGFVRELAAKVAQEMKKSGLLK